MSSVGYSELNAPVERYLVSRLPLPFWKRGIDVLFAGSAMVALAPIALLVGVVSVLVLGRPVLFRQARGGHGGVRFEILKFRTMTDAMDSDGHLLPDDERRSRWGNFLRKTSLDEIPTLLNILRGEMTLVGPRPLMAKYLDLYSPLQAHRHCVTPGLTGLAQTRGRNTLTWEQKFDLDLEYVETRSLPVDLRILRDTFVIVLSRKGADGNDHTTEFVGNGPMIDHSGESPAA